MDKPGQTKSKRTSFSTTLMFNQSLELVGGLETTLTSWVYAV